MLSGGRLALLPLSLPSQGSAWSTEPRKATSLAWTTSAAMRGLRRGPRWGQDTGAGLLSRHGPVFL